MKIVRRITFRSTPEICRELETLGIRFDPANVWFDISESDPAWPRLFQIIRSMGFLPIAHTEFTQKEIESALWLQVQPTWHHGYPKPDMDFGYLQATYNCSNCCEKCGSGYEQAAPFRFSSEPKWGKKSILQLNWVFDEYFVKPELWEKVFRPLGIPCREVVQHRSGAPLTTVVQLDVNAIATGPTHLGAHPFEICPKCGRKRFLPFTRGFFPPLADYPDAHIFKTSELFGSGASSWRAVIISQELCSALRAERALGVNFVPLANDVSEVTPPLSP